MAENAKDAGIDTGNKSGAAIASAALPGSAVGAANAKTNQPLDPVGGPSEGSQIAILNAFLGLDPKEDKDWTEDGRPSLKRIRALAKSTEISQSDVDATLTDKRRPTYTKDELTPRKELYANANSDVPDPVHETLMCADETGFSGNSLRKPGEVFLFSGVPGPWMHEATKEEIKAFYAEA